MFFNELGKSNTEKVCSLAIEIANERNINYIVVSSNTGYTAKKLIDFNGKIVCVTHQIGFRNAGEDEMSEEAREFLSSKGINILTTTHLMGGIERAALRKFGGSGIQSITAHTLRMFGQGTKVCVEIAVMALDAGLIPYGEDIICIGGSGRGADSAWIIRPEHSHNFYDSEIKELICKPRVIKKRG